MASIYPFRAFRYNPERAGAPLEKLLTQPYDKITPAMQARYYGLSPHNLIRLELGKPEPGDTAANNVYTRAAAWLAEELRQGVLVQDARPAFYAYFQDYTVPGTKERRVRKGLIALGKLEDYAARVVYPHERTWSGPKADRLELLRQTRTQSGQLFLLYADPKREVERVLNKAAKQPPAANLTDEYEVTHRLWVVDAPEAIERLQALLADKKLVIADGHHRYETALAYRDECRTQGAGTDGPHERAIMTLINMTGEGLTILPTHRLVHSLPPLSGGGAGFSFARLREAASRYFDWYAYPFESAEERRAAERRFRKDLVARGRERPTLGVYAGGEPAFYLFLLKIDADLEGWLPEVSPKQRALDVVLLHRLLLERCLGLDKEAVRQQKNLRYVREWEEAVGAVERGEVQVAFLMNPIRPEQVGEVALAGEVLPQKSTDFYPKLLSGLTLYRLDAP
ncbi:MAG: DUF1015 domain-containing protein [Terriglobia bacterium]